MRLKLPYPPSTNRLRRQGGGGSYPTKEATTFKAKCKLMALTQLSRYAATPIEGPVGVWVRFFRPRKVGDTDNRLKALLDALNGIAYKDDSQVAEIHLYRYDDKENPRAEVLVRPLSVSWPCVSCREAVDHE